MDLDLTPCTADITGNTEFQTLLGATEYKITGSLSCPEAIPDLFMGASLSLEQFDFTSSGIYPD